MSSTASNLGLMVKRLQHSNHRALDKGLAPLGLSLVQWNALREIDRNPGASQHRLAEATFNSDQAFGTLATRLQDAGLVKRHRGGGRAFVQLLTEKGLNALKSGTAVMTLVTEAAFARLDEREREELESLLSKILDADHV